MGDGHITKDITKDSHWKGGEQSGLIGKGSPCPNRGKQLFGNKEGKNLRPPPTKGGDNEGEEHGGVDAAATASGPAVASTSSAKKENQLLSQLMPRKKRGRSTKRL